MALDTNKGGSSMTVCSEDFSAPRPTCTSPQLPGTTLEREMMFLVALFLSGTNCKRTYKTMCEEMEEFQQPGTSPDEEGLILPARLDWTGTYHQQSYDELLRKHPDARPDSLPQLMERLAVLAAKAKGDTGFSRPTLHLLEKPHVYPASRTTHTSHPLKIINERELRRDCHLNVKSPPGVYYKRFEPMCSVRGHVSAIYTGVFDRAGSVYITGADDSLVKIWCAHTGNLMRTLRGHTTWKEGTEENHVILDMAVSHDNTMFATASSDKSVMVWNTQTWVPIIALNIGKSITTISFSPSIVKDSFCLVVGCKDGKTRVYRWKQAQNTFESQPLVLETQDKRTDSVKTCAFNQTGSRLAVGGSDGLIYLYQIIPKSWLLAAQGQIDSGTDHGMSCTLMRKLDASSLDYHDKTRNLREIGVKEVRFSHHGDRFVSGCMDGTATVFSYNEVSDDWDIKKLIFPKEDVGLIPQEVPQAGPAVPEVIEILDVEHMDVDLPTEGDGTNTAVANEYNGAPDPAPEAVEGVTALCWSQNDTRVITASDDFKVRVWDSVTAELYFTMEAHVAAVYNLAAHPKDPNILLSASYDGRLVIWDIERGIELKRFEFHHSLTDASFRADGTAIGVVDLSGMTHFLAVGISQEDYTDKFEQFFACDFDNVVLNAEGILYDPTNDAAPHLVPMLAVIDSRYSPYPGDYAQLRKRFDLDRPLPLHTPEMVMESNAKLKLVQREAALIPMEHVTQWTEKDSRERRKARPVIISDSEAERIEELQALIEQVPIVPLPVSSGDEFDADGVEEEEEPDGLDEYDDFDQRTPIDDADFIDDDDGDGNERRKPHKTKRKKYAPRKSTKQNGGSSSRRRHSEDESEDDEAEFRPASRRTRPKKSHADVIPSDEYESDDFIFSDDEIEEPPAKVDKGKQRAGEPPRRPPKFSKPRRPPVFPTQKQLTEVTEPSQWVTMVGTKRVPYLPQLGDLVVYIKAGHRNFVDEAREQDIDVKHLIQGTPLDDPRRPEVIFGVVDKLQFYVDEPVKCLLSLHVHDDEAGVTTGIVPSRANLKPVAKGGRKDILKMHFWDLEGASDFIILYDHYAAAMHEQWEVRDDVEVDFPGDRLYAGHIETVMKQESPWNQYVVRWHESPSETTSLSPWELLRPDSETDVTPAERLSGSEMTRIADILRQWRARPDMIFFKSVVDYTAYPSYLATIAYPVCLEFISERIKTGFYRRKEAVAWDVETMLSNAMLFNQEGSELYEIAERELPRLRDEIMNGMKPGNQRRWSHANPHAHDDASDTAGVKGSGNLKLVIKKARSYKARIASPDGYDDDEVDVDEANGHSGPSGINNSGSQSSSSSPHSSGSQKRKKQPRQQHSEDGDEEFGQTKARTPSRKRKRRKKAISDDDLDEEHGGASNGAASNSLLEPASPSRPKVRTPFHAEDEEDGDFEVEAEAEQQEDDDEDDDIVRAPRRAPTAAKKHNGKRKRFESSEDEYVEAAGPSSINAAAIFGSSSASADEDEDALGSSDSDSFASPPRRAGAKRRRN
ncbi:hypothetical protein DFJ77DRAFT_520367 [Powellomyces hirtus]|nr:hypothetical protein DFJ77DRAFT_520367 [Powellomyces hirtus]